MGKKTKEKKKQQKTNKIVRPGELIKIMDYHHHLTQKKRRRYFVIETTTTSYRCFCSWSYTLMTSTSSHDIDSNHRWCWSGTTQIFPSVRSRCCWQCLWLVGCRAPITTSTTSTSFYSRVMTMMLEVERFKRTRERRREEREEEKIYAHPCELNLC